jgi:hypothetical protein
MLKTFIGTYIPDFNSIPSAVLEKKFLENRPIRIFKVNVLLLFAPFENSKWPPAIIIVHWTICNGHYPDLGTFLL